MKKRSMILALLIVFAFVSCDLTMLDKTYIVGRNAFKSEKYILGHDEVPSDGVMRFVVVADPHFGRVEKDRGVTIFQKNLMGFLSEMEKGYEEDPSSIMPLLLLGDVADNGSTVSMHKAYNFLHDCHYASPHMPIVYTCGNHELESTDVRGWERYFTPEEFDGMLYLTGAYKAGNVSIYNLNSAYRLFGGDQLRQLEGALKKDESEYKLFLSHIPLSSYKIDQTLFEFIIGDERERNEMLRLMESYGPSFMLTGHHHKGNTLNEYSDSSAEFIFSAFHRRDTILESPGRWYILELDENTGSVEIFSFDLYTEVSPHESKESWKSKCAEYHQLYLK